MKKILKLILITTFVLITINQIWGNLVFENNVLTILKVALILALFELILKPIIKILLLPINILTLGTIRIVIDTLGLYLAVFLLPDFQINNITTPTINFNGFLCYLVTSLTITIILNFYKFILSKKTIKT